MPSILNLKFKGNKSFVAFSNLGDAESLTKTWKVCTKVASYLEQGQRLENLSWRLWHLQSLMVDTDNAKSKREFKKLSKCMGDKLDKEKGRAIEELSAPAFQRNPSTDLIRQRAAEKERVREAHANTPDHIIQRMQFTFAVEPFAPAPATTTNVTKTTNSTMTSTIKTDAPASNSTTASVPAVAGTKRKAGGAVRLPTLFSNSFGPEALLATTQSQSSLAPRMNYGDAHSPYISISTSAAGPGDMRISRPTIELPLDELLNADAEASDFEHDMHEQEHEQDSSVSGTMDKIPTTFPANAMPAMGPVQNWSQWDDSFMRHGTFDPAHGFGLSFPMYGPSPSPNDPLPLTLDPNAAFGPQLKHEQFAPPSLSFAPPTAFAATSSFNSHNTNSNTSNHTRSISTPTIAAPRSPHLSPNAYFMTELEPEPEDDAMDGTASQPQSSVSAVLPPAQTSAPSASKKKAGNKKRLTAPLREDDSSDDGGDDSADSDFFDQSASARAGATRGRARPRANTTGSVRPRMGASGGSGGGGGGGSGGGGARRPAASAIPTKRPVLSVRVPASSSSSSIRPASTPLGNSGGNSGSGNGSGGAPGGVKAECSNCGATHTPLWRRGLNDELNCNACGLYCKLHKRPRPKTMRNSGGGDGGARGGQSVRAEAVDVMEAPAQCYNCHTTATPLWRKDDEGKTVCNACGLYYKLHGSARPISMKSDVIRKRSRHDARRGGPGGPSASISETPTASPGVSRRASPSPAPGGAASSGSGSTGRSSPVLSPDTSLESSLADLSALNTPASASASGPAQKPRFNNPFSFRETNTLNDALPFSNHDVGIETRVNKRRRMSVDSASEPPSSATSYSGYGSASVSANALAQEFPFSRFPNVKYNEGGNGNGNGKDASGKGTNATTTTTTTTNVSSFWHPPMMPLEAGGDGAASGSASSNNNGGGNGFLHPPMLPPPEESMEYTMHPPMMLQEPGGFFSSSGYNPPMSMGMGGMYMGGDFGMHPPMMPYEDIYGGEGGMHY
ncbi:hypothetical protein MKEN_01153800 [Mycena kentingensis (nom. inval.)]|nr:hypothetical protein MKEN_01153800 [Mycena kentingensis (nom. inval.)]